MLAPTDTKKEMSISTESPPPAGESRQQFHYSKISQAAQHTVLDQLEVVVQFAIV